MLKKQKKQKHTNVCKQTEILNLLCCMHRSTIQSFLPPTTPTCPPTMTYTTLAFRIWAIAFWICLFFILCAWPFSIKHPFNPGIVSSFSSPTVVNKQYVKCCGIATDPPLPLMSPSGYPLLFFFFIFFILVFAPHSTALPTLPSLCIATQHFSFSPELFSYGRALERTWDGRNRLRDNYVRITW